MGTIKQGKWEYVVCETGVVAEPRKAAIERIYKSPFVAIAPDEAHLKACMAWLRKYATPRKTVNTRYGSYGLKHVVERTAPGGYVTNGALIEAAYRLGYGVVPDAPDSPNACLKLAYDKTAVIYMANAALTRTPGGCWAVAR